MKSTTLTIRLEAVACLVILLVGAWIRLSNLGWPPLSDAEARQALAASALAGSPSPFDTGLDKPPLGSAYKVTSAILFQLFGSSDTVARAWPAIGGVALCLLPLVARRRLGVGTSLVLSALLSFSPVMVTVSRQAGGTGLAGLGFLGFLLLLIGREPAGSGMRRTTWATASAALALTSGPAWVQGLVGLGLGVGFTAIWRTRQEDPSPVHDGFSFSRRDLMIVLLLVLGIATGLGLNPGGAADTFESLAGWLSGWSASAGLPILSALLILPVYEPLLLVFGFIGAVISFRSKDMIGAASAFWALGALIAAAIFPSRTALDLMWVAIPSAYLASRGVIVLLEALLSERDWLRFLGMTAAFVGLAAFIYLQLAAYASGLDVELAVLDPTLRIGIIFVALLISVVLVVLFGTGWSWSASGTALGVAILGLLSAISVSSIIRLNFVRQAAEGGQLWQSRVAAVGLHQLAAGLDFLSRANLEDPGGLTLSVEGSAPPSLVWTVRGYGKEPVSASGQAPPVVLAPSDNRPSLRADYLGQSLAIAEINNWIGALPLDAMSWWILHRAPVERDNWVMLVRADVATQGGLTALGSDTIP